MGRDKFEETIKHMIEYELRLKLEYLMPYFAENLRRALDHGEFDRELMHEFYSTMIAAHARLWFMNFGDHIIMKVRAPGYTMDCLMPISECDDPMSYEDFAKHFIEDDVQNRS